MPVYCIDCKHIKDPNGNFPQCKVISMRSRGVGKLTNSFCSVTNEDYNCSKFEPKPSKGKGLLNWLFS